MTAGANPVSPSSDRSALARSSSPFASSSASSSTTLTTARSPASVTARATWSACQYMSKKRVVPERIISTAASLVPQ